MLIPEMKEKYQKELRAFIDFVPMARYNYRCTVCRRCRPNMHRFKGYGYLCPECLTAALYVPWSKERTIDFRRLFYVKISKWTNNQKYNSSSERFWRSAEIVAGEWKKKS